MWQELTQEREVVEILKDQITQLKKENKKLLTELNQLKAEKNENQ